MKLFKFAILLFVLITVTATKPSKSSEKLNFLFIIADDLNCALGAYGDSLAITPNIDKLAKEGLIFDNAHVQYPLCGPSRVSLMTVCILIKQNQKNLDFTFVKQFQM